jgi:hypothetical protein
MIETLEEFRFAAGCLGSLYSAWLGALGFRPPAHVRVPLVCHRGWVAMSVMSAPAATIWAEMAVRVVL